MKNRQNHKNATRTAASNRKGMAKAFRSGFALLLTVTLGFMGVPATSLVALAQENTASGSSASAASDNGNAGFEGPFSAASAPSHSSGSASSASPSSQSPSSSAGESSSTAPDERSAEPEKKTIATSFVDVDGSAYTVKVVYGEDANIPDGAALSVTKLNLALTEEERKDPANKERPYDWEAFASKEALAELNATLKHDLKANDDYLYLSKFLQISIVDDGSDVQPDAPIEVIVETNAIAPTLSDGVETALISDKKNDEDKWIKVAEARKTTNLSADKDAKTEKSPADDGFSRIGFETDELGEFALAGIAAPCAEQECDDVSVEFLAPRSLRVDVQGFEIDAPDEGQRSFAFGASTDPEREFGTCLWTRLSKANSKEAESMTLVFASPLDDEGDVIAEHELKAGGDPVAFKGTDGIVLSFRPNEVAEPAAGTLEEETTSPDEPAAEAGPAAGTLLPDADISTLPPEELTTLTQGMNAISGQAYNVSVTFGPDAGIGEGARLRVRELPDFEQSVYGKHISRSVNEQTLSYMRAFDIAILDPLGNEIEPAAPVSVSISLADVPTLDTASIVHFDSKEPEIIKPDVSSALFGSTFEFEADSFSVYAVAGYTVDFHWGNYTYSIAGESSILLSELLGKLDISVFNASDVTNAVFSNPSLVKVEKVDSDWLLTSLRPFQSEEKLSLTLKDGRIVNIRVTDEGENPSGTWSSAAGSGTWEIDADGLMTITGTGKMPDYTGVTSTPWEKYRSKQTPHIKKLVVEPGVTYLAKNMLTRSPYLTEIDLSGCGTLSGIQGADLFKCGSGGGESATSALKRVDLSNNPALEGFGQNAFQNCNVIEYVDISNTNINLGSFKTTTLFSACSNSLKTLKINNFNRSGTLDVTGYSKLNTIEMQGSPNISLKLNSTINVPLSLYVSRTFTRSKLTQYPNSNNLTIYFDGSYQEWVANGFTYDNGKWGNVNVVLASKVQIVDDEGRFLYFLDGGQYCPATFTTLKGAYDVLDGLYVFDDGHYVANGTDPVNFELVVDDYYIKDDEAFSWDSPVPVTLTSQEGSTCTYRPDESFSGSHLFTVDGATLSMKNIIIDCNDSAGAVDLSSGSFIMLQDAIIRNGAVEDDNGTVNVGGTATLAMSANAEIEDCSTAVYVGSSSAHLRFSGSPQVKENDWNVYVPSDIEDTSGIITAAGGLGSAHIGVYIANDNAGSSARKGAAFGTVSVAEASNENLVGFVNDRFKDVNNNSLRGWPAHKGTVGDIIWASPVLVKFVEMDDAGNFTPLGSMEDSAFALGSDGWSSAEDVLEAIDLDEMPVISGKDYFYCYGLGASTAATAADLGDYAELSDFYLKDSAAGILYSADGTGDGTLVNGMNAVFAIFSQKAPADSALLSIRNISEYSFAIDAVQTWDTPGEGEEPSKEAATLVAKDESGMLSLHTSLDIDYKSSASAYASVTVLKGLGKNFGLRGRCTNTDLPEALEAEFDITNPSKTVFLSGSELAEFPESGDKAISGVLIDRDRPVSVVINAQAPRAVHVSKQWIDNTVPEGADKSHGHTAIEVRFLDSEGYAMRLRSDINTEPGVEVSADQDSVTLSKIEGEWPASWMVYVPETAVAVEEMPVSGYISTDSQIDPTSSTASITNERAICKIDDVLFPTLNSAVRYATEHGNYEPTVEMLLDYTMPSTDALSIPGGSTVTITTALEGDTNIYAGEGVATITRDGNFTSGYMFDNDYENGTLIFSDITIDGNGVESDKAMIRNSGSLQITSVADEVTLKGASCSGNGGAIESTGTPNAEVSLYGATIVGNHAANGGAIYIAAGNLSIEESSIGGTGTMANDAVNGGAIYYIASGSLDIINSTITRNHATGGTATEPSRGGAIFMTTGTLTTSGTVSIDHNDAVNGGAIFIASGVIELSEDSVLVGNEASGSGGAIYAGAANVSVETPDGDTDHGILSNVAGENGGAIYAETGAVSVSNGYIGSNRAVNGGAIYTEFGTVSVSGGAITENTASNGSTVFTETGTMLLSSGNITDNTSTGGGAIGIGDNAARLHFSEDIYIRGNHLAGSADTECNVYLDKDSDAVINTAGLGSDADVGIYVPGDMTADLFKHRGQVGASFGTFTGNENLGRFVNDRLSELQSIGDDDTRRIMWGSAVQVQIRRLDSFSNGFPPTRAGDPIYPSNTSSDQFANCYLPSNLNPTSSIADNMYSQYSGRLSQTNAFAGAFIADESTDLYSDYITDVNWNNATGGWEFVKRDGTTVPIGTGEEQHKLVIFYSEPAYVTIENNNKQGLSLDIGSMTFPALGSEADASLGYGFVVAKNGVTQSSLKPMGANDFLLRDGETRKLMFPGGVNQAYELAGAFKTEGGQTPASASDIDLTRTANSGNNVVDISGSIPASAVINGFELGTAADTYPNRTAAKTLNKAGATHEIVFGERDQICKIVAGNVETTEQYYTMKVQIGDTGEYEYLFGNIRNAVSFGQSYLGGQTVKVEMLVDYPLPANDTASIDSGYKFEFTTALEGVTRGSYCYEGEGNATISRDTGNLVSLISVPTGGMGTELSLTRLNFDGKNFAGNTDGGVVKTRDCKVTISYVDFNNCRAANGGAIYSDYSIASMSGDNPPANYYHRVDGTTEPVGIAATNAVLDVSHSKFNNCYSNVTILKRQGGGAIHTTARKLIVDHCEFTNCESADQGGALFHKIESTGDPTSCATVTNTNCTTCKGAAAGGIELDCAFPTVRNCDFNHCSAWSRNCGALNLYTMGIDAYTATQTTVTVEDCDFDDCTVVISAGNQTNYGGGIRSTALDTSISGCNFNNVSGKRGGAIATTNEHSKSLTISNCKIGEYGGASSTEHGAGIYCVSEQLSVSGSLINNCSTNMVGGGIYHLEETVNSSTSITGTTISNCRAGAARVANISDVGGAGMYVRASGLTITGSTISNCSAAGHGGGLCYHGASKMPLVLDGTSVTNCSTDRRGGGVYFDGGDIWIKNNTSIQYNKLTTDTQINAAGVYMPYNGWKLIIGSETIPSTASDGSSIANNTTASGLASNFKMKSNSNPGSFNPTDSIEVRSNLSGSIGVINAGTRGRQFGTSYTSAEINKAFPDGFSDLDHVFVSDDKSEEGCLYGITDRTDTQGFKIIWAANPVCKITAGNGALLYTDPGSTGKRKPAVFDRLNDATNVHGAYTSAFNLLRGSALDDPDNPVLYYADGTPYTGDTYCVKMLVENYTAETSITTLNTGSIGAHNKTILFTTAESSDADRFPYRGKPGTASTVRAGNAITGTLLVAKVNMNLANIVLDGNDNGSHYPRLIQMSDNANMTVTLGQKTTLRNAHYRTTNWSIGAGVDVDKGRLVIDGATITNCKAETTSGGTAAGGGVYVAANGSVQFRSGKITNCSAGKGGGIYLHSGRLEMSGGEVSGNNADTAGGGIGAGPNSSANARMFFSGNVTVYGNTLNRSTPCNVQLDYDKNDIIQCTDLTGGRIGVYVPDGSTLYDKHGELDMPFGTYSSETDVNKLRIFSNDRNGYKGGFKASNPNIIYWVKDFSLNVTKTVDSPWESDKNTAFDFIVILSGATTEGVPAEQINGRYGDMYFTNGVATRFKLRDGQNRQATDLPEGLYYSVSENLTISQRDYYTVEPSVEQSGTIGENINSDNPAIRYVSTAGFLNRHAAGEREVILRKMSQYGESLNGARLSVYRGTSGVPYTTHDETLSNLPSSDSGVFWVGMISYGTYYLQEDQAPVGYENNAGKWFCLIVDDRGAYMSENGYYGTGGSVSARNASAKEAALADASAVRAATLAP